MAVLDHVGIYVSDLERSLGFYQEVLGLKLVERMEMGDVRIATLEMGGGLLELIQREGSPGKPPQGNWSHVALYEPKFEEALARLESRGVEASTRQLDSGVRLCFFRDPDGHTIELMEKGFKG